MVCVFVCFLRKWVKYEIEIFNVFLSYNDRLQLGYSMSPLKERRRDMVSGSVIISIKDYEKLK